MTIIEIGNVELIKTENFVNISSWIPKKDGNEIRYTHPQGIRLTFEQYENLIECIKKDLENKS